MNKKPTLAIVLFAIIIFIIIGVAIGAHTPRVLTADPMNLSCPVIMADIIASAQGDVYNMEGETDFTEPKSYYLASYSVEGDKIVKPHFDPVPQAFKDEQKDVDLQSEAWQMFTTMIPLQDREMVGEFNVFTDGFENTLAAVDQRQEDPTQWVLEIDIADLTDTDALMFTMIHEYAHILTLNASQMEPDQEIVDDPTNMDLQKEKAAACPNYFTGMGCSHADSYIDAFYNRFWLDINDEWSKVDALQYGTEDFLPYYNGLYDFYKKHQDQFLDDYSATHPAEDIAEAFTYFVFSPKPTGNSIKEQKILFFYDYPELVELRQSILAGTCP
jgi:hypothetical protein